MTVPLLPRTDVCRECGAAGPTRRYLSNYFRYFLLFARPGEETKPLKVAIPMKGQGANPHVYDVRDDPAAPLPHVRIDDLRYYFRAEEISRPAMTGPLAWEVIDGVPHPYEWRTEGALNLPWAVVPSNDRHVAMADVVMLTSGRPVLWEIPTYLARAIVAEMNEFYFRRWN